MLCVLFAVGHVTGQSEKETLALAERLSKMGDSLKRPETMLQDVEKHLDNLKILKAMRADLQEIQKTHGQKMKTSRGQGPFHKLDIAWNYADRELREYERYARMVASPQAVTQELDGAMRLAKLAIENKAPAFIKPDNSLHRHLSQARLKLSALEAYDPQSTALAGLKHQLESTIKQINDIQVNMKEDILKGNEMPSDAYCQPDREKLLKMLQDKWAAEGNGKPVLKLSIVTGEWIRKIYWQRVGSEWHLTDVSRLQGYVIVKHNDQVAVKHSINFTKDHLAQDKITASFLNDPKQEPELVNMLLLAKVK